MNKRVSNKGIFDSDSVDELGRIINSKGFVNIQNMLNQYFLGNVQYVTNNLNISQYKYLSKQILRLTSIQKKTVVFKNFIFNTVQILYSSLQNIAILNQNSIDLAKNEELLEILKDKEKLLAYIQEMSEIINLFPNQTMTTSNVKLKPEYQIYINNYGFPENGVFDSKKIALIANSLSIT
jgi:hypothetical protein